AFLLVLQLITWTGSLMALGAPILLTESSEKEKRSSPGGSSLATRLGWSVAVSVSCTLNSLGAIVEAAVSASYHWQGLIPEAYWYLIASGGLSSYSSSAPGCFTGSRAAVYIKSRALRRTSQKTR